MCAAHRLGVACVTHVVQGFSDLASYFLFVTSLELAEMSGWGIIGAQHAWWTYVVLNTCVYPVMHVARADTYGLRFLSNCYR